MVADPDNHGPDLAGEPDELRRALTPVKELIAERAAADGVAQG